MFGFLQRLNPAASKGARQPKPGRPNAPACLVLYASQTGQAEDLARKTHARLVAGGIDAQMSPVSKVKTAMLHQAKTLLFIASSTGEGDAPDMALRFEQTVMTENLDLSRQACAVLALGNANYDEFCGFGHRVFDWLEACGADLLIPCLEVDDLDPIALRQWDGFLDSIGAGTAGEVTHQVYADWRLESRTRLNPTSSAAPLFQLDFAPLEGTLPTWQAGDLAEIVTPGGHRRDYSVSTLPEEGLVRLWVRQITRADGRRGEGSGWLTEGLAIEGRIQMGLKSHTGFHYPENATALLLIGAGSGLAGLRAHLLEAKKRQTPCWVVYGERHPEHDGALPSHLGGFDLHALETAFSQPDRGKGTYVQHIVRHRSEALKAFLSTTGAIMVCGGVDMGKAVNTELERALGAKWLRSASDDGRYRRDLY